MKRGEHLTLNHIGNIVRHFILMYMSVLPICVCTHVCVYVYPLHSWYLKRAEGGIGAPQIEDTDGFEPPM